MYVLFTVNTKYNSNFCYGCICLFPERGHDLGRYIHEHPCFTVNLEKPGDSTEVKELKTLLSRMLSRDSKARPLIQEVVMSLSLLRTALGVQVVRLDTVWKPATFYCGFGLVPP